MPQAKGRQGPRDSIAVAKKKVKHTNRVLKNFGRTTSSHGIPQIGYSFTKSFQAFWAVVFLCCLCVFSTQAFFMVKRFLRFEKSVNLELRFESAPFPAVTVCNLNPYKNSLVQNVKAVQEQLTVLDHVRKSSKEKDTTTPNPPTPSPMTEKPKRNRPSSRKNGLRRRPRSADRWKRALTYEPVHAFCNCPAIKSECSPIMRPSMKLKYTGQKCFCFRQTTYNIVSPCYNEKIWQTVDCIQNECSAAGRCKPPKSRTLAGPTVKCMCPALANYCVVKPDVVPTIGDPSLFASTTSTTSTSTSTSTTSTTSTTTTTSTTSTTSTSTTTTTTPTTTTTVYTGPTTVDPTLVQNLGFEGMTDATAIVTKAKENLVFTMASLPMEERIALSHQKEDFLKECSFNGKQCDIENDFALHVDPVYGNCFIFNYDSRINRTSSRAGPMYGLRLLTYSNVTDYMPTTEASGIRMQIHEQSQMPFPDTFGYSAPNGFVSSFGVRLKEVIRLPAPFGDCMDVQVGRHKNYIYDKEYSTEGCFRSCFQHMLLRRCQCGDPRFPVPPQSRFCKADDPVGRGCLEDAIKEVGGFHGITDCDCPQPCQQEVFGVSYSASTWPADNFKIGDCNENNTDECVTEYRSNAAMLEIYYEQLNFELVEETEAYGISSLLADFGGQLGLWMGFSVITIVEFLIFFVDLFRACLGREVAEIQDKRDLDENMNSNREPLINSQRRNNSEEKPFAFNDVIDTQNGILIKNNKQWNYIHSSRYNSDNHH